MICFPNAKINLGLHVTSKRPDGYHNIESVIYPIPFFDVLEFFPSDKYSLKVSGLDISSPVEDNLVTKAWNLLNKRYGIPSVSIHLLKTIPAGSGLGGGSADASFLLKSLNLFFNLKIEDENLVKLAAELGSDCQFFIENKPALVMGRGEIITPIDGVLKDLILIVVYPGIPVSSREAYEGIIPSQKNKNIVSVYNSPIGKWKNELINDFESHVFSIHPDLRDIKDSLYQQGAAYVSLSGSGSGIYGIFNQKPAELKINSNYLIRWVKL